MSELTARDLDVLAAWLAEDPGQRMLMIHAADSFPRIVVSPAQMWKALALIGREASADEPANVVIRKTNLRGARR